MDSLILRVVLLCIAVCFGPYQSQGRHVFQPKIRNVSMTKNFHHLQLEWDAQSDSKEYHADPEIVFNIQVNQTEENRIVLDTNYTVSLSELKQPLEWSWAPLVPLQCEPHVVRIRSLVRNTSFPHSETWSDWSPWEAVAGLGALEDNKSYIFPMGSVVKAGSNFSFCCVARETEIVDGFNDGRDHFTDKRQRKVLFHLKNMHAQHVACLTSDEDNPITQTYVIGLPHKPNSFSCEIERRLTLSCSWKTNEKEHPYYYPDHLCETQLILSNVNYTKTYCNQTLKEEHHCSFPIRETRIPKLRLTARNCFGESHTDYDFYENHKAPSGQLDIWRDIRPGSDKRNVTIFWKRSLDFRENGNIHTCEIRWEKVDDPAVSENRSLLPKFNSTTIFLDYDSYKISVSAKNVVNSSSPSVMIISRTAGNETIQETKDVKIKGTSEGISVSWQPQARFDGYVVDWCSYPQSHPSDFQWEKFGGNYSSAVIKSDAFRFNVTYIFRVYGSLNNTTELLEKKALYLKEYDEDLNKSSTPVETHGSYKNSSDFLFGSLLLLAILPIMLIICVCFWKSSCIRKRCFPTIPRPDISPFLKLNLGTMKICDVAPDKLEVMENHQISKGKQSGLGMLITENITYFDPTFYLNLQEQEAESNKLNPPLTSYKPLQDVFPVNSLSTPYKPLQDFFLQPNPSAIY